MNIPGITEARAAKQGNEKWGTDISSIMAKLYEEIEELDRSFEHGTKEQQIDELSDVQFLVTRLTFLIRETHQSLLLNAMEKHRIRETNPDYKKSRK